LASGLPISGNSLSLTAQNGNLQGIMAQPEVSTASTSFVQVLGLPFSEALRQITGS